MSWEEKKSIRRIFNLFKRAKDKVYTEDVEALKQLSEALESYAEQRASDSKLYVKLLCVIIRQHTQHYGSIKLAIAEVSRILKAPLNIHLEYLSKSLNETDKIAYFKSVGIDFESLKLTESIEVEKHKGIIDKLNTNWPIESVSKSFYATANDFLKDPENYS